MAAGPNMDTFDVYFRTADLDRDGRISGQEAVAFFQGSNLPKQVLAQIWMHSDPKQTGFLGRTEFYNALRLVTVAQSGRELTPDIVKAALYGPATAKIPAPQINPVMTPTAQINSVATPGPQSRPMMPPSTQMGQMGILAPNMSQTPPLRGPQAFPNTVASQQFFPSDNRMRPTQPTSIVSPIPLQGISQVGGSMPGSQNLSSNLPNPSTDWLGTRTSATSAMGTVQVQGRGATSSISHGGLGLQLSSAAPVSTHIPQTQSAATASVPPKSQESALSSLQTSKDSKSSVVSGNGFSSHSLFGDDVFSATPQAKQNMLSASSMPNPSGIASVASGPQNTIRAAQLGPLQNTLGVPSGSNQLQPTQTSVKQNQLNYALSVTSGINAANTSAGPPTSTSSEPQQPWPKMTQSDIQKYTRVFVEVDKDRDGKITGEQARNLFLSWRLPREILKQVWDLSDQDNDRMLSLREFCTALYLMERYREGRPLPPVLPNSIKFDEILLRATGQPSFTYGDPAQRANPGFSQQGIPGPRTVLSATGTRPPLQNSVSSQINGQILPASQTSRVPVANFHIKEQVAMDASSQVAADVDQKVPELDKEILDSKEKIEFYRTKMQELVLYKSRCDNRLNEITERASADKREVESLGKKYEEKYKQVGEVASKLAVEEARFRDIQERKLELHNAIIKVEQGGSADGLLQVRADRIQSDLEELEKALNERCKRHGLDVKPTTTINLPFGWQPGVQEGSLDWDEDWDKFEDEGFTLTNDPTVALENVTSNARPESPMSQSVFSDEVSHTNGKIEKPFGTGEQIVESGTAYAHSEEESTWSPPGSPGRSALETPLQEYHPAFDVHDSPHAKESSSEHLGAESTVSGDRYTDEHNWGANFDSNDDADSVWGFGSINTKESDHGMASQFFGSTDFGLNPIKVDSPSAVSVDGREKRSFFDDSVPSTPLFKSGSPPGFNDRPESRAFDNYSRFDSFNMNDGGLFNQRETLTRFDSISSTARDFDRPSFPSFDDADPFGSSGPFKSSERHSPRRDSGNWNAF